MAEGESQAGRADRADSQPEETVLHKRAGPSMVERSFVVEGLCARQYALFGNCLWVSVSVVWGGALSSSSS